MDWDILSVFLSGIVIGAVGYAFLRPRDNRLTVDQLIELGLANRDYVVNISSDDGIVSCEDVTERNAARRRREGLV